MQLALLGTGPIAQYVAAALAPGDLAAVLYRGTPLPGAGDVPQVRSVAELPDGMTHLLDCAGHEGLRAHGAAVLEAGIEVLTLSLGAFADAGLTRSLEDAATRGGTRVVALSGAIGGLDALRAAAAGGLETVRYVGRKPPQGWRGSPAAAALDLNALTEAVTHFQGSARDACLAYPKNANVAAAVALSGLGFDATEVQLVADPNAPGNTHRVEASGDFGTLSFEITGNALPGNPKSSALAAMSAVAEVRRIKARIST